MSFSYNLKAVLIGLLPLYKFYDELIKDGMDSELAKKVNGEVHRFIDKVRVRRLIPDEKDVQLAKQREIELAEKRNNKKTAHKDSDGCFISTACAKAEELPDDCVELETLRVFRDNYVRSLPDGEKILREYYEIAPSIVTEIYRKENSKEIYQSIKQEIDRALILINLGKEEKAFATYCSVVKKLKQKYINKNDNNN